MSLTKEQVQEQVCEMIARFAPIAENGIRLDANLREHYGVDSLILVELLVEAEEHFGIAFDSSSLTDEYFATADAIASYVSSRLEAA
ncbi:acyl carrier protein [Gorillibacterium sp. CAU 1737]|uniref:acyl carrier protein n=1 Tax=Gorillibacterium sp. CAU 1737 TaxID=3140362 RepID=UPI003261B1E3